MNQRSWHIQQGSRNITTARWTVSGSLTLEFAREMWFEIHQVLDQEDKEQIEVDLSGIEAVDSSGIAILKWLQKEARERGKRVSLVSVPGPLRGFIEYAAQKTWTQRAGPQEKSSFIIRVGLATAAFFQDLAELVRFIGNVTLAILPCCREPKRFRLSETLYYLQLTGADALPIISLISFLMGLIMAFQAAVQLRQFGANIFVADLVSLALARELAPLLTAIVLAGRSASAFAAELGTMKINEEVDALTVMGMNITEYLVIPKVTALSIAGPLLTFIANATGILGGIVVGMISLDITPIGFLQEVAGILTITDVLSGIVKSFVFALLVALVGCFRGLETELTSDAVGRKTTSAVVTSIFVIILSDAVFTILYHLFDI